MLRIFLLIILVLHALIHLLGFAKGFGLSEVSQLRQDISRTVATLWLLAALVLMGAAVLLISKSPVWWMLALAGVILSQVLIFTTWQDARFGTIANIIVLIAIGLSFAHWNFTRTARNEMHVMLSSVADEETQLGEEYLESLPPVVQAWLSRAQVEGKPFIITAMIYQKGEMKTSPGKAWVPFVSEQAFTTREPGFLWIADVKASDFMRFSGKDSYLNGKGHMLIKAYSIFPVVDETSPETDQGTMLRYLAESIWLPTNALNEHIKWKQIDDRSAEAVMSYKGVTASGVFSFDKDGDPVAFDAQRYYLRDNGKSELRPWLVEIVPGSFRNFGGYRIPTSSRVIWKLPEGQYHWLNLKITGAEYNLSKRHQ